MLVLKFLIMAVAALVDKIFQSEFHPARQLSRVPVRRTLYDKGIRR